MGIRGVKQLLGFAAVVVSLTACDANPEPQANPALPDIEPTALSIPPVEATQVGLKVAATIEGSGGVIELTATETPTYTPVPATATLDAPTATPTPEPQPTATPEVLPVGMVAFEFQIGDMQVRTAVPTEFLNVLSGASAEEGVIRDVEIANLAVEDNTIFLGDMPLFLYDDGSWIVNPSVYLGTFTVDGQLQPALLLNTGSLSNPSASQGLNPAKVHSIQEEDDGTLDMVSIYPAYFESLSTFQVVVILPTGQTVQTGYAEADMVYLNSAGSPVVSEFKLYSGFFNVNNKDGSTFDDLRGLFYGPVILRIIANFANPDPANLDYQLRGIPASGGSVDLNLLEQGTTVSNGITNIGTYTDN